MDPMLGNVSPRSGRIVSGPGHGQPGAPGGEAAGEPTLRIQLSALQALCRQVLGFRLAMIALATPFTLTAIERGWPTLTVGAAILFTFMGSYLLFRDWERFGPLLLKHPALLGVDAFFGALLLLTASPVSSVSYVTMCTPLLAGMVYGWRGAGFFASLTLLIVVLAYAGHGIAIDLSSSGLLPGACVLAGAVGVTLRNLMLRFGAASQALWETRSRLAVTEAIDGERARLAREMHDSVAKTLHGLALAADGLAGSADRMEPLTVKHQAELVARSARRAANESRELLSDLRRESGIDGGVRITDELPAMVEDFGRRTGIRAVYRTLPGPAIPAVPQAVARQLTTIVSEAMENAHRHANAGQVEVVIGVLDHLLRVSVFDDGAGLPAGTSLEKLRKAGHFGLVGMVERAAGVGARIRIGRGRATRGTEVRLDLPLSAVAPPGEVSVPSPLENGTGPPAAHGASRT
ncbi:sensor histidine kinase [Streptomyces sp. TP-A0874]|uniref:sensor histidine kinase n=1 Tax=Streptomyces sp. TP-A0874 TaxID=549819 RepID=UPI000B307462|nr:histidine kinase [Streptomyces sp. TP-A0874]